jgi:hypothetical protein
MPRLKLSPNFRDRARQRIGEAFVNADLSPPDFLGIEDALVATFQLRGRKYEIILHEEDLVMVEGDSLYECYMAEELRNEEAFIEGFAARLSRFLEGGVWEGSDEKGLVGRIGELARRLLKR